MATFTIDTSEKRITAKNLEVTSEDDLVDLVNGLIAAGRIMGWDVSLGEGGEEPETDV